MTRPIYAGSAYLGDIINKDNLLNMINDKFTSLPDNAIISIVDKKHVYITLSNISDELEFTAEHYFFSQIK